MKRKSIRKEDVLFLKMINANEKYILNEKSKAYFYEIIDLFIELMKNPNEDNQSLHDLWNELYSFTHKAPISFLEKDNEYMKQVFISVANTEGTKRVLQHMKEIMNSNPNSTFWTTNIRAFQKYIEHFIDPKERVRFYVDYIQTFKSSSTFETFILEYFFDLDLIFENKENIFPNMVSSELDRFFRKYIFDILNQRTSVFFDLNEVYRFNDKIYKTKLSLLKKVPDNFIELNISQVEKLINLYHLCGKDDLIIKEIIRIVTVKRLFKKSKKESVLKQTNFQYVKMIEKTFFELFHFNINCYYSFQDLSFFDFELNEQLFLLKLCKTEDDLAQIISFIKEHELFDVIDDVIRINEDQKELLKLSFKI